MAKLYFYYASMNAGKSTNLLQANFNYGERGMATMLWTAALVYDKLRPFGFPLIFLLLLVIPWLFPGIGIIERIVLPPVEWLEGKFMALTLWVAGA